jgi:hypothetical protein
MAATAGSIAGAVPGNLALLLHLPSPLLFLHVSTLPMMEIKSRQEKSTGEKLYCG